jgi:hypothetical protein
MAPILDADLRVVSEREVVMKTVSIATIAIVIAAPAVAFAGDINTEPSAAAIREAVSGKTCVGNDVLIFGESAAGSGGTYERVGRPSGSYSIGHGTILIRRGRDLHGHVTSVSVPDHMLYMSAESYRCGQ